ncbi:hypothetical protein [Thalassomonas haliotis]|uniref:LPXTG cell wall anchor domain-containing protein n=1 Tax=Thalassomonas haliotis TaxID=485448 RepID=A0ABY7VLR9_9GAMM|nr:hypothetical protein [Thalassomonas haliotis]WDE13960.1 hypothetical protein H3N35_11235 [Thalassomonas haliotis]
MNKTAAAQENHQQSPYSQQESPSFRLGPEQQGIIYAGLVLLVMVAIVVMILRKKK